MFLGQLANIYVPNVGQARFLSSVLTRLASFGGPCYIIGGDLNVVMSPSADTSSVYQACSRKQLVFVFLSCTVLLLLIWNITVNKEKWDVITLPCDKARRSDVMTVTPWLAPIVWEGTFNIDIIDAQHHNAGTRIGLTVFVIRKYVQFIKTFLETAEKFFLVGHKVNYYVLTDQPSNIPNITLCQDRKLFVIEVPSYKRWQDISMRRMKIIQDYIQDRFTYEVDYLVCLDVDMKFTDHLGAEILSDVFGVIHPGFYGASRKEFTNERRPESAGYISEDEGDFYYTGCFFGGKIEEVYKLTNHCHHAMLADKENNMEARWHDESYLNRFFLYYKPTKVLSPEYAWNYYYGDPKVVQKKRFIQIEKDLAKVRDRRALSPK